MKTSLKKINSKTKIGFGIALTAFALSISVDNVSASEVKSISTTPVIVAG